MITDRQTEEVELKRYEAAIAKASAEYDRVMKMLESPQNWVNPTLKLAPREKWIASRAAQLLKREADAQSE